jgi:hypothetical protein
MRVQEYISANAGGFFAALKEWIAIPSISGDPALAGQVAQSARWLARHLRDTGFPKVEIRETPGLPAVFAEWPAQDPRAPAVLVYGHHDVQPVTPLEEWQVPPFAPVDRDGQLTGRGASDDKGQVLFHALGLRANLATSGARAPPVTIKLLIEARRSPGRCTLPACSGKTLSGCAAKRSSSATAPCGPRMSPRSASAPGAWSPPRSAWTARLSICTRGVLRRYAQPGPRAGPPARRAARPAAAHPVELPGRSDGGPGGSSDAPLAMVIARRSARLDPGR